MFSIPISFPETYGGFAEADGIARFDGKRLYLEFEVRDGIFGVLKSGVKEVALSVSEIASVHFKRKTFGAVITLRSMSVRSVENIPSQKGGEFKIGIKRAYRDEAEEFVSVLRLAVSEAKLDAIQRSSEL